MPIFDRLTDIHGRRISMSATGAIVDREGFGALMVDSCGVVQGLLKTNIEKISSSSAVLSVKGLSYIQTTSTVQNYTIPAPSSGQEKEIFVLTSASSITIETTSSDINFLTTGNTSSAISIAGANVIGESIKLTAISNTRWAVLSKTNQVTV